MNIEDLKNRLEANFPNYEFKLGKRIYGKCIIAKKSKYSGADIYVKENSVTIEAAIPEMKTRLLIGSGALLLKMFRKDFNEPCLKISEYLKSEKIAVRVKD